MHKKSRPFIYYSGMTKRADGESFITTALFVLPKLPKERQVIGGATFDGRYLEQKFFPAMLEELVSQKMVDQGGNPLAMVVYPVESGYES